MANTPPKTILRRPANAPVHRDQRSVSMPVQRATGNARRGRGTTSQRSGRSEIPVPIISSVAELVDVLKNAADFSAVVTAIKHAGLIAKYASNDCQRVLITHDRIGSDYTRPVVYAANGIVYNVPRREIVCMPSPAVRYMVPFHKLVQHYGDYTVREACDGSTINLYHDGDAWRMGTIHAYDVSTYKWIGPRTYRENFDAVVAQYTRFSFDTLDKSITYTVGFRCSDFHPLTADPSRAWLVSAQKRDGTPVTVDIGIPLQRVVTSVNVAGKPSTHTASKPFVTTSPLTVAPNDTHADKNTIDLSSTDPETAIDALITACRVAYQRFVSNGEICYGFMLSSESCRDGEYRNVYVESSLMNRIRKFAYNLPKHENAIDHTNRAEYIALRAYLHPEHGDEFVRLFPQFKARFVVYEKFVNDLVSRIMQIMRNKNVKTQLIGGCAQRRSPLDALAMSFVDGICKLQELQPMSSNTADILRRYVRNPECALSYIGALHAIDAA